mmetsp:Transcript_8636/g.14862  ORF Transcript_8636/g.14862 Transcript_8636/m.14862 type:complete len:263 (-) Transcript_8636:311-1099(-)|eukprot:CAMPEP_0119106784 /NCGR_PEP_ID=MMETSP1180-20130426/6317_1 /TAXON_ID=3052 ORGANISM="Chlamydomonas cf sp, Strain CCMP681" /NCGR_SAMPLE_ID=MMETSP1180 /ASSEMBLY_ACC=CAM_ASM_000741 /LENGTH=262 /DNA_ID=CAMNT_0007092171 /DNA_START=100 /DNA_END=888 /DNA_ORIENTATION=+
MAFHHVTPASLQSCALHDPFCKSQLLKWDMLKGTQFHVFRYTKYYHRMAGAELAADLYNDPAAQAVLQVLLKKGAWQSLEGHKITGLEVEQVPANLTRMDIFDKLQSSDLDPPVVRGPGLELVKRMDDLREGFQVSDNLRQMLLCEESDNAELYTPAERSELLWRLFEHISLGGPCCQYEDQLGPYLSTAKQLYKELVTVQKNSSTGKIEPASTVFRIKSMETESGDVCLFPTHSRNNFCYLAMDPVRRLVRVWYHAFVPFW